MAHLHRYALASLAMVAASCARAVASFIERFVLFAINALAEPFQVRQPLSTPLMSGGGSAGISPALFYFNRHEAGVSRRSADRNT